MVAAERGHQRADTLKPQSQTTSQSDHMDHSLFNSMKLSHAVWGYPRWAGHGGEVYRMWSTGEGNGKPLQYSCLENPMNSMKRQNDRILKDELPRSVGANMLLEISGEITPERMKGWSQSKNNTQLWMRLVIEARSDAVKSNIAGNRECQVHESRQIGSGQTRDGKSERRHSKNQRTKMDWDG